MSIDVTINVTNVEETPVNEDPIDEQPENRPPVFTEGSSTTRSVAENTNSGVNIGTPVTATDTDGNTLTYSLVGTDANAFAIDTNTGQLQTSVALDYETKSSYTITITADDGNGGSVSIDVTINVTDIELETEQSINVQNRPPVFTEGSSTTRSVAENTNAGTDIGSPVSATDPDGDTLTYSLGGTDKAAFGIVVATGQLWPYQSFDYETKSSYTITITADDGNGESVSITVIVNVTNVNDNAPVFTEGDRTARKYPYRSSRPMTIIGGDIGAPVSATDADGDTLTYSFNDPLPTFFVRSATGQLMTKAAFDLGITVTLKVSDGTFTDTIDITVNSTGTLPNEAPVFTDGNNTTRSIAENTEAGVNIGSPVSATDADEDTLTYSLGGTDATSFSLDSGTGQLRTSAALDYETKSSYSIIITADDGDGGSASIPVTVNVTNVNDNAPIFTEGSNTTRKVLPYSKIGIDIGTPVSATDADGDTLTYRLGGPDANKFSINSEDGQLIVSTFFNTPVPILLVVTVTVSDGTLTDTITVSVTVSRNRAPVFTEGSTIRSIAENTEAGTNIGSAVTATDPDGDTLTYSLGGTDAASFSLDSGTGQLRTSAALDYETKSSYSIIITADDGDGGSASIPVTVNVTNVNDNAPIFTEGSSTTRSVHRKIPGPLVSVNVGSPVTATDSENDEITYRLSGTDSHVFSLNQSTGQLRTQTASFFSDLRNTFSVKITASDGSLSTAIDVTINIDNNPVFSEGSSTTRSIAENRDIGVNIDTPVTATDPASDTLTYSLGGTDADSFRLNSGTGQLKTGATFDYETKSSYTITVTASNTYGGSKSITVTVNVTNVNEAPVFTDGTSTTRSIGLNPPSNAPIGKPVAATDPEGDTLTYSKSGTKAHLFGLDTETGQLKMSHHNFTSGDKITMTVTDGTYTDTIEVTIEFDVTPIFSDGKQATRSVATNAAIGTNVGSPITAADPGNALTHTYQIIPTGSQWNKTLTSTTFSIDSSTGQLQTKALIYLNVGVSYTFKVKVFNSWDGTAFIDVTVTVVAQASAPAVQQTPDNTALLANYPNPFNPETWIPYQLSKSANVTLTIYNMKGEMVRQLALGHKAAGNYLSRSRAIHWDGKNQAGEKVATGVYFYRFTAGDFSATRKMLIIK